MDPPRHDELRRIIQRTLAPTRIATMVPAIKAETRARLDYLRDRGGSFDFVADFSRPLLFSATGKLLGLDDAAAAYSTELTSELFHHDDGPMGAVLPPTHFEDIIKFLGNQLASRQMSAGDDLFSVLLEAKEAGAPLNDQEIVANLSTVLLAGNASIGHFFPNLIHALWLHPDERRKLIDDPSKILAAIEEAVRWDTSTQSFARHIMKDVEIEGVTIPADSRAVIFYASANRDERAIDDPDRFDIDRRRIKHFGFGAGAHHCAGAHVSRVALKAILEEALDAFGEYELDLGAAKRVPHVMVRGFMNLPMSFARRRVQI
jgi:cytochrome P450